MDTHHQNADADTNDTAESLTNGWEYVASNGTDPVTGEPVNRDDGMKPGGVSDWRSPLSIRETLILLFAVGGFIIQWQQLAGRLDLIQSNITVLSTSVQSSRSDFTVLQEEVRRHEALPGHSVAMDRMETLQHRMDSLEGEVRGLSAKREK
jgi:hypothetical protein